MVKIDRNLLFLYSENCREKIKDLSTQLKKSSQRLKYSIDQLEKERKIITPHTIFDYSYLGLIQFKVYFKGGYISESDKERILKMLNTNSYVTSIYELNGEFDLVIEAACPNPSRFNKELKKIIALKPTLNNYKIILNVVTYIYPANYLLADQRKFPKVKNELIIGGDRDYIKLNDNELKVISILLDDPKTRMTSIAKESGLNIKTVASIIESLTKRKIIRGYKYLVETNNLGFNKYRLFLKLHNVNEEREKELLEFCKKTKEIITLNKTVGDWDIEIDVETNDKTRVRKITADLREKFKDLIENFNMIEYFENYKRSFLPRYMFEKKG